MDGHSWIWAGKYTVGIRTRVRTAVGPLFEMLHIYMVWLGFAKTHTYPVWGMTTLRQFRSSGPMRAPCSRGLSLGLLVPNVYWVLFLFVPGTLAAPCLICFGFQPGCTFETTGKCVKVRLVDNIQQIELLEVTRIIPRSSSGVAWLGLAWLGFDYEPARTRPTCCPPS